MQHTQTTQEVALKTGAFDPYHRHKSLSLLDVVFLVLLQLVFAWIVFG